MATDTETAAEHGERTMHSLLIVEAARWLSRKGHTVVITDMTHAGPETADAIGWRGKWSTLVECKASRSDFLADKKKCFRRMPDWGMGNHRYFCAPAGIIKPEDLPERWGLLEWREQRLHQVVEARHHATPSKAEEVSLLISAVRRIGKRAPKGISVRCYQMESKCRATLGVDPESTEELQP